jgi:hypothetical protein
MVFSFSSNERDEIVIARLFGDSQCGLSGIGGF